MIPEVALVAHLPFSATIMDFQCINWEFADMISSSATQTVRLEKNHTTTFSLKSSSALALEITGPR